MDADQDLLGEWFLDFFLVDREVLDGGALWEAEDGLLRHGYSEMVALPSVVA